eukprot:gene4866-34626_t
MLVIAWEKRKWSSPDVSGVSRARGFAKKLNDAPLAIIDKRRSAHNESEVMNIIGDALRQQGAREVYACASHAVFSPPAIERLSSGVFNEVIVTNTIPVRAEDMFPGLTVLSVANVLGESIWRVYNSASVQALRD